MPAGVVTLNVRHDDLIRFYSILNALEDKIGGGRMLADCSGRLLWPERGVYFFREKGELRNDTGKGPRIVRVGTHALRPRSATKLWRRLSHHKGSNNGGGNHRQSIFRQIVGAALISRDGLRCGTWEQRGTITKEFKSGEVPIEREVSSIVGAMSFVWVSVQDASGPDSRRQFIERNSIGLLSNYKRAAIDPPSPNWLGLHSDRARVRESGLWNSDHVDEGYGPNFLDELESLIRAMRPTR